MAMFAAAGQRDGVALRGYLMARSVAPKRTWNATVSKRLSKKVSGKPFPLQMLLLAVQPALLEPHKDYTSRSKG
jgi:hypothetical protein